MQQLAANVEDMRASMNVHRSSAPQGKHAALENYPMALRRSR